jgi:hypothetical protein
MTNAFLENIEEMFEISILCRKDNWIGHILSINFVYRDTSERQMTGFKGLRRRTELLDDLKNIIRY